MLETLDADAVRRWCGGGLAALRAHQREIDELNVYPVPDGDTGTNLVLTLASAQAALDSAQEGLEPARRALERPAAAGGAAGGGQIDGGAAGGAIDGGAIDGCAVGGSPAAADAAAESEPTPLASAMRRMARGALLGARGNSGVIVSQILRGMADTFAGAVAVRGAELARALRTATDAAYAAVARPVEGTVLTVLAAAADGAGRIASDDLGAVARAASRSAAEALARTPQQLPALAQAGVVDAGGRGLCLLLDALVEALGARQPGGEPTPDSETVDDSESVQRGGPVHQGEPIDNSEPDGDSGPIGHAPGATPAELGYEVQYLLDAGDAAVDTLREALGALGDSLVIVGTGAGRPPTWNVHVHVQVGDIGAAIEAGVDAGRPHRISVTRLTDVTGHAGHGGHAETRHTEIRQSETRHTEIRKSAGPESAGSESAGPESAGPDSAGPDSAGPDSAGPDTADLDTADQAADRRGAVVVAAGEGLTALFRAEGATVVGRNPSTAEMLAAIDATGAGDVVLLPNDANTHAVASSAAREASVDGVRVSVVPTRSPVQALAALAVRDARRPFTDDVIAMAEAAGACRYGEVCTAGREALTVAGRCRPGDLLGLVDGEVRVIGADLEHVCRELLDRMLGGGGELATLVLGADAPARLGEALAQHVAQAWPFAELQCYAGGQPRYHLLVGVE